MTCAPAAGFRSAADRFVAIRSPMAGKLRARLQPGASELPNPCKSSDCVELARALLPWMDIWNRLLERFHVLSPLPTRICPAGDKLGLTHLCPQIDCQHPCVILLI
jgi:hypothetical protein